jgi:hypothetical protein
MQTNTKPQAIRVLEFHRVPALVAMLAREFEHERERQRFIRECPSHDDMTEAQHWAQEEHEWVNWMTVWPGSALVECLCDYKHVTSRFRKIGFWESLHNVLTGAFGDWERACCKLERFAELAHARRVKLRSICASTQEFREELDEMAKSVKVPYSAWCPWHQEVSGYNEYVALNAGIPDDSGLSSSRSDERLPF